MSQLSKWPKSLAGRYRSVADITTELLIRLIDCLLYCRNADQRGWLLSAFYWGYTVGQIPSVMLVKYMPAKNLFVLSIAMASLFTLLLPWASEQSFHLGLLARALTGMAESAAFPSAFYLYKSWVPYSEKTIMITVVMAGIYMVRVALCNRPPFLI